MARIRTIKPEFFSSERIAQLSRDARLTFIGLWTESDDYGVAEGNARVIKGHLWAFDDDVTPAVVERHIAEMLEDKPRPLIQTFEADGRRYIHILGWPHQKINRPSGKRNPSPPGLTPPPDEDSRNTHGGLSESSVSPHCPEVEVEVEVEVELSSSSGPVHHELSTGRDEDDPVIDLTSPTPPTDDHPPGGPTTDTAVLRAWDAAKTAGRADMRRASAAGANIGAPTRYALDCARARWALDSHELIAAAREHPLLEREALLAHVGAMAAHPASGPSAEPWHTPALVGCDDCLHSVAHPPGACPFAGEPLTAEERAAIEAERRDRGDP